MSTLGIFVSVGASTESGPYAEVGYSDDSGIYSSVGVNSTEFYADTGVNVHTSEGPFGTYASIDASINGSQSAEIGIDLGDPLKK